MWNYYRDEINDSVIESNDDGYKINSNKTITSKSFEYKTKIGKAIDDNNSLNAEVVVPLKYLSNFWTFFGLSLINCEIELDLSWSKECVISEISITTAMPGNPDATLPVPSVTAIQTTGATFQINNAKHYAPVVTLSINDNLNFLENIKQGFKRTISQNKYKSEIKTQTKSNKI